MWYRSWGQVITTLVVDRSPDDTFTEQNIWSFDYDPASFTASNPTPLTFDGSSSNGICLSDGLVLHANSAGFLFSVKLVLANGTIIDVAVEPGVFNVSPFFNPDLGYQY